MPQVWCAAGEYPLFVSEFGLGLPGADLILRGDRRLKSGCFFGKLPKGGGVISDPKNYIALFLRKFVNMR